MTYPPDLPPSDRADLTPAAVNHADDHNTIALALTSILEELGPDPSGAYPDLGTRLTDVPSALALDDAIAAQSTVDDGKYETLTGGATKYAKIAAPPVIDTDYATLELALAATAVGGTLEVRGTWSRATAFPVNKSCRIVGARGGSITQTSTGNAITVSANDVTIDGLILTGTGAATAGTACAIAAVGTVGTPIDGLILKRNKITGWSKYGIYAEQVTNFNIDRNTITTIAYGGIMVTSGIEGRIVRNRIATLTQPAGFINSYGIAMTRDSSVSLAVAPRSSDIECSGNTVTGVTLWEGIDTHGGQRLTISNNRVFDCNVGIALVPCPDTGGVDIYAPLQIIVSGNTIDSKQSNGTRSNGILIVGAGVTIGTPVESATAIITNNTIIDHGAEASLSAGGAGAICAYFTSGLIVSNNNIVRAGMCGIQIYHSNIGVVLSANVFEDTWTTSAAYAAIVYIRSTNNTVTINGTRITRGLKSATIVNSRGLQVSTTTANVVIDGAGNNWNDATLASSGASTVLVASVYGAVPVVRAGAIASPTAPGATYLQAEASSMRTQFAALRDACKNFGITS